MESSSNFYEFEQQLGSYSSSAASQSTHGLAAAAIHQWTPTLPLNSDEYNHYMNEILPISAQLGDIRCDDKYSLLQLQQHHKQVDLNQNHWLLTNDVAASSSSSCSNFSYAFDGIYTASSTSCSTTTNLASDFPSYFNHGNNKDKAISSGVKRVSTSSQNGAAVKKKRAASQSSCSLPKGGKEKMGDRIAALHRLVAPFGKTDSASVLTEAIGYIHFLHHQIQTLSMPCTQSDRPRCFQGVLSKQKGEEKQGGLTSRGLSLVPISVASYISSSVGGLD